ncbi:MAG: acyl-CoA dehydrogenase C-terminal domain-containing protein [Mycobacterium sp.]
MLGLVEAFLEEHAERPELSEPLQSLINAMDDAKAMAGAVTGYLLSARQDPRQLYRVGLESVRFLLAIGDLIMGWLLLRHAEIALTALDGNPSPHDREFYLGKVAVATFFANSVLPRLRSDRHVIESIDLSLMELDEASF